MKLQPDRILNADEQEVIRSYVAHLLNPSLFHRIIRFTLERLMNIGLYFYIPLKIHGIDNIKSDESLIVCANHSSLLDGIIIGIAALRINRHVVGLTAVKYMHSTFIKLLTDFLPFDQHATKKALAKNLKYIDLMKDRKKIFILFPEGTRSPDNTLQEFKHATAWIAANTKLRVVPACITGAFDSMPKGACFPKPKRISIAFGEPVVIPQDKADGINYTAITEKIRESIQELKSKSEF